MTELIAIAQASPIIILLIMVLVKQYNSSKRTDKQMKELKVMVISQDYAMKETIVNGQKNNYTTKKREAAAFLEKKMSNDANDVNLMKYFLE